MKILFRVFFLVFSFPILASNLNLFQHKLESYPKSANQDCQNVVEELSQKFKNFSNREFYYADATNETETSCNVRIWYYSQKPLPIKTNIEWGWFSGIGTHQTMEDCLNGLEREKQLFRAHTGIEPWVSYCYEHGSPKEYPWAAKVEGIGESVSHLFKSETLFTVKPNFDKTIFDLFRRDRSGLKLVSVIQTHHAWSGEVLSVRFYSDRRIYLSSYATALHLDASICERQIDELRQGLFKSKHSQILAYCGKHFKDFAVGLFTLSYDPRSAYPKGVASLTITKDPKPYVSYEACRQNLPKVVELYKAKLEKNILGAFCGNQSRGRYEITLFEEEP